MSQDQNFVCPHCQSGDIQRFAVAYQSGLSQTNTKTTTLGAGFAGKFGVGAATSNNTGVSQTALSQSVSPPVKSSMVKIFSGFFVIYIVFNIAINVILSALGMPSGLVSFVSLVFTIAMCGALVYFEYKAFLFNKNVFPGLMESWQRSWICFRCGNTFEL